MLRLPLHVTHSLLTHPIDAYDIVHGRDAEGEALPSVQINRPLKGNMQPAGYQTVQLLPEGLQSDGAMVLHTDDPVYIADNGQGRQTYVRQGGQEWRAVRVEDWSVHSPINRYVLVRRLALEGS